MKAKLFIFVCLGSLLMHSCSSDEVLSTDSEITDGNTVSMVVPVGSRAVRIDYPTASGMKSITASINPQPKVVDGRDVSSVTTTSLDLFSTVNTYVNIYDENGNKLVGNYPVKAKVAVPPAGSVKLPEDAVNEYVTTDGPFTFYHSSGVAMFEDVWPYKTDEVDADFDDVVVDYDIEVKTVDMSVAPKEAWRESLKVVMHLRTVGGMFPTAAGLVLEGLDTKYIDSYDCKITLGNWNKNIPANSLTSTVDLSGANPVISLNNIGWVNSAAAAGTTYINSKTGQSQGFIGGSPAPYYNVTPGYINKGGDLFTLTVIFKGKNRGTISKADGDAQLANYINAVMDTESQNFFIRTKITVAGYNNATHEIHMKGYNPTPEYAAKYKSDATIGVSKKSSTTYCSADNYNWGIKVPVLTRHAWEEVSFYKAYPEFESWMTSNGTLNLEWYKTFDKKSISDWW